MHTHPPTHQQQITGGSTDKVMTYHKEPTHPPQSERACHNKQSDPPHTHQQAWAYTGLKDARVHYPDLKQQPHTTPHRFPSRNRPTQPGIPAHPTGRNRCRRAGPKPQTTSPPGTHLATWSTTSTRRAQCTPDGGGSDSSEPQQCVCLEPRNGVTGSCRHPPRAPPSLTPGALAGGPERAGGVVCFHIFQRHHQRQDTNGPGLGVCSLERR